MNYEDYRCPKCGGPVFKAELNPRTIGESHPLCENLKCGQHFDKDGEPIDLPYPDKGINNI